MDFIADKFNMQRIQATADCEIPRDKRFLEVVGFEVEARMKRYGPNGNDFYLMTRFF
jgi:RimJ/RimL family protein N-acetyltransferase